MKGDKEGPAPDELVKPGPLDDPDREGEETPHGPADEDPAGTGLQEEQQGKGYGAR